MPPCQASQSPSCWAHLCSDPGRCIGSHSQQQWTSQVYAQQCRGLVCTRPVRQEDAAAGHSPSLPHMDTAHVFQEVQPGVLLHIARLWLISCACLHLAQVPLLPVRSSLVRPAGDSCARSSWSTATSQSGIKHLVRAVPWCLSSMEQQHSFLVWLIMFGTLLLYPVCHSHALVYLS